MRRSATTLVLGSVAVTVLVLVRPHPSALAHRLTALAATRSVDPDVLLAQLSADLLWLVAGWLAAGIATTLLASAPGFTGRVFGAASRRLLPAALRRLVAGSAGLGVLLAPIPSALASAPAHPSAATALPAPVWPGAQAPVDRPDPPPPVEHTVRVRPGDSLWLIAAHRLGPTAGPAAVAAAWPRWYAANRDVIGDDPNLIVPGQLLSAPERRTANGPGR